MEQYLSFEILLALRNHGCHTRALAKELDAPHTTVGRRLYALYEDNVVDMREEGRNRVYFIKDTLEARCSLIMAEIYRFGCTLDRYPLLRPVFRSLVKEKEDGMVILFGSYAKWNATPKSDIDIFIETQDRQIKRKIEQMNSKLRIKTGDFDRTSLLIREIEKNHVIIRGVEDYIDKTRFSA